jgi:hypothetical protein
MARLEALKRLNGLQVRRELMVQRSGLPLDRNQRFALL